MNKIALLTFFLLSFGINADTYNEALKYDAKGESEIAIKLFNSYFDLNINDINQDGIIEKLLYCSTLLPTIDQSMEYLIHYVKFMKSSNSRFRIYNKIAQIYELTGQIYNAGIYYEKAAYTVDDYIDYFSLLNSVEMLVELGYYYEAITKIENILIITYNDNRELTDKCILLLTRIYKVLGNDLKASDTLSTVENITSKTEYYKLELDMPNKLGTFSSDNFEKIIVYSPNQKLKTPSDFVGIDSMLKIIPNIKDGLENEYEIFIGKYDKKIDAAGIVNIANQMNLPWFFDENDSQFYLYIFSQHREESIEELNKLGIKVK